MLNYSDYSGGTGVATLPTASLLRQMGVKEVRRMNGSEFSSDMKFISVSTAFHHENQEEEKEE